MTESVKVEEFVPVEETQKRMCRRKEKEIDTLHHRINQQKASIQKAVEVDPKRTFLV